MGVLIAGMRRSGSTVAYQMALEIVGGHTLGNIANPFAEPIDWENKRTGKTHWYIEDVPWKVLVTVRDPRDIAVSCMNVTGRSFDRVMEQGFISGAINEQLEWERNRPDLRICRYETFYKNLRLLALMVADAAGKRIGDKKARRMADDYSIPNNMRRASRAHNMRPDLLFPGHIQDGRVGQWQGKLTSSELEQIYEVAGDWMEDNGYTLG